MIGITDAEWVVLGVVWREQPVAAGEIEAALAKRKGWTLSTVRTLLRRLVDKGALRREREGKRFLYSAEVTMEACARSEGKSLLDRFLGRVPSEVVIHLVNETELSKEDIRKLKRILRKKEG